MSNSHYDPANRPSFFEIELKRALEEQSFGITNAEVVNSSGLDATALITLLEGAVLEVVLFRSGYRVLREPAGEHPPSHHATVYETIEDLLSAHSPEYVAKKHETLFAKLDQVNR
ncbi:hypothetical protein EVG20_g1826 [Dentipellis fragilis]|uniref:GSKIP domain-containing protein n=1 Tax=Dentipellis fragilis TaxID=205917 RepID=A0A4Y9ZBG8_9AGAM|nr:hypothetical protein EVG20_g1826 [Dentipellis fragilis]